MPVCRYVRVSRTRTGSPAYRLTERSGGFLDLAGSDAAGARLDVAHGAVEVGLHALQIGVPAPLGLVVGVTDVVADRRPFAAHRALSHVGDSLQGLPQVFGNGLNRT